MHEENLMENGECTPTDIETQCITTHVRSNQCQYVLKPIFYFDFYNIALADLDLIRYHG